MSDARLVATNPKDSTVVPVACNEKGELKVEPPQVVQGPPGKDGEDGKDGQDGKDAASFVPDPSTGVVGSVLTSDGTACSWKLPTGSSFTTWSMCPYHRADGSDVQVESYANRSKMFDGDPLTTWNFSLKGQSTYLAFVMPIAMTITKIRMRVGTASNDPTLICTINGKNDAVRIPESDFNDPSTFGWTEWERFQAEQVQAGDEIRFSAVNGSGYLATGWEFNGQVLLDGLTFNQQQLFAFEENLRSGRIKR